MVKVGILGASGYTGYEILRLLLFHPEVDIVLLTSNRHDGEDVSLLFPALRGFIDKRFETLKAEDVVRRCDLVFSCLPHKVSMSVVPNIFRSGIKVIDLSADYRLKDGSTYERWYSQKHNSPELLKKAAYGLTELNRDRIKSSLLVANPGCYPTSILLGLAPLLYRSIIDSKNIIADSKSGVSGAGKSLSTPLLFSEANEHITPYSIASHRHTPEIEQELSNIANHKVSLTFTPHLIPVTRGLISTIYCSLTADTDQPSVIKLFKNFYKGEQFIRISDAGASSGTASVIGSNLCDISIHMDKGKNRLVILSAIDNLLKGASGQAVQNMNVMCSFDEDTALKLIPSPL